MNQRKYLISLLLGVFSVILVYNFFILQYFGNSLEPMGMNRSALNTPIMFIDVQCMIIVGALLATLLLVEFLRNRNKRNACRQCGKKIENSRWKVCPVCGTVLNTGTGG